MGQLPGDGDTDMGKSWAVPACRSAGSGEGIYDGVWSLRQRDKTESCRSAREGAVEEKTCQESVTCLRSHHEYSAGSVQERQEFSSVMWETASCLPELAGVTLTELTAVSLTVGAKHIRAVLPVLVL